MGPNYKDYYKILGVGKTATEKEIKTAYRKLARKYHPDVNPGDKTSEDKFKEVQEANDVLSDSDKRSKYDRYGDQWKAYSQAGAGGFPGGGQGFPGGFPGAGGNGYRVEYGDASQTGDLNDLFASLFANQFGGAGGSRGASPFGNMRGQSMPPQRGQDTEAAITVSLEDAYNGATKTLNLSGEPRYDVNRSAYAESGGRRVEVKIPAGVTEGQKIRLTGQGGTGPAGNGDLYLIVNIAPHSTFERKGDDLYTDVPVPYTDAALGGEVKVPTPKGTRLTMRIPAGVQSGQSLRLGGQGMPKLKGGGHGDLYARIKVTVPKNLSERERELLTELQSLAAVTA